MTQPSHTHSGSCACGFVTYRLVGRPLIVHGCHCRRCQRQTGAPYAINALFEDTSFELVSGSVQDVVVETPSGAGQSIARCPRCQVAVYSRYHATPGIGDRLFFVRVGTLTDPDAMPPDVHIHTESRQPHVALPEGALAFEAFYRFEEVWPAESQRRAFLLARSPRPQSSAA